MKILLIIVKNTSVLDFAIPLLWKVKKDYPKAEVSILYFYISKKKVLRNEFFYSEIIKKSKINEYDFTDFMPSFILRILSKLFTKILTKGDRDKSPKLTKIQNYIYFKTRLIEHYLLRKVKIKYILPKILPNYILMDNRLHNIEELHTDGHMFYTQLQVLKIKTILLPHGQHHGGIADFLPFHSSDPMPRYCEYWIPFRFDKNWLTVPEKRHQFFHVGYPGLDSEWLDYLKAKSKKKKKNKHLNVLFITRKILREGEPSPPTEELTFSYKEFFYYLKSTVEALETMSSDYTLYIKPHPNNNYDYIKTQISKYNKCEVTYDSIYSNLFQYDIVIGVYSTTLITPIMANIPVILLHSRFQDFVHEWAGKADIYNKLSFYVKDLKSLPEQIRKAEKVTNRSDVYTQDSKHIRYFWPDTSMQSCFKRLSLSVE